MQLHLLGLIIMKLYFQITYFRVVIVLIESDFVSKVLLTLVEPIKKGKLTPSFELIAFAQCLNQFHIFLDSKVMAYLI